MTPSSTLDLLRSCLLVTLGFFLVVSNAHAGNKKAAPAPTASPLNIVAQTAAQKGLASCATRINQVTNFLGFTPQAGVMLMVPPSQVDQRIMPVVMSVQIPQVGDAYVSTTFAPNQANGCGASYDAVVYWPAKCDKVAEKQFAGMKKGGTLGKNLSFLDGGVSTKVFLMPAGQGCVSIKKEMVM